MPEATPALAPQFEDAAQQREASHLGMWLFLATEVLFFGGLFMAYILYRHVYPAEFAAGSRHTDLLYGTLNTAILLTSSLTMALSVHAIQQDHRQTTMRCLHLTLLLAAGFLLIKGFEYHEDFVDHLVPGQNFNATLPPRAAIFFWLYWTMTGLHAIHVIVGMGLLTTLSILAQRGRFSGSYHTPVELVGLYWHFVDLVWIFLYPLLYLINRHS
jgi:cytochrome c oxidase subunit 3